MIGTVENAAILDGAEQLALMVTQSEAYASYCRCKRDMDRDRHAQQLIRNFMAVRERYDEVQRFGRYHPDYKPVIKEMMESKRELDTDPMIAEYKKQEARLSKLLQRISQTLAHSVSAAIKVPSGDPFFDRSCSGGCGSGGSCGCRVQKRPKVASGV